MRRHILGALAATVAASYLVAFLVDFDTPIVVSRANNKPLDPLDLLGFIDLGTELLEAYGIPLLILASLCVALLYALGYRTKESSMLIGAILGSCFVTVVILPQTADELLDGLVGGFLSGAICGWIYWLIAIRGQANGAAATQPGATA